MDNTNSSAFFRRFCFSDVVLAILTTDRHTNEARCQIAIEKVRRHTGKEALKGRGKAALAYNGCLLRRNALMMCELNTHRHGMEGLHSALNQHSY